MLSLGFPGIYNINDIAHFPKPLGDTGCHCRSGAKRLKNRLTCRPDPMTKPSGIASANSLITSPGINAKTTSGRRI